ncbi:MAG: DUF4190 domain-containing protein [Acidimicrobiales bacterium]
MSDSPGGPGWWLASDGKWYPPQAPPPTAPATPGPPPPTAPSYSGQPVTLQGYPGMAPPAYGAPIGPPSQKTDGLAIASLVCSLLFFLGLTPILAIIFGFVARERIKRAGGAKTGDGLAVSGIVLGFVGLALFIVIGATSGRNSKNTSAVRSTAPSSTTAPTTTTTVSPTTTTTTDIASGLAAANRFTALVTPVETATGTFGPQLASDTNDPGAVSQSQLRAQVQPLISSLNALRAGLEQGPPWPQSAQADISTLDKASGVFASDAAQITQMDAANAAQIAAQLTSDFRTYTAALVAVTTDLSPHS